MRFKATIEISTRQDVLNPEAKAILQALQNLDIPILDLSLNKKFYINIKSRSKDDALKKIEKACKELLANPVIEDYTIELLDSKPISKSKNKTSKLQQKVKNVTGAKKPKKQLRAYKYDEFLDPISDFLREKKYQENVGFALLTKAVNTAYNTNISVKAMYDYFKRKLDWKKDQ